VAAKTKALRFALTGPGVENLSYGTAGGALSRAITAADHHEGPVEFLVHDVTGELVGKAWKDKQGTTKVWRTPFIGATA